MDAFYRFRLITPISLVSYIVLAVTILTFLPTRSRWVLGCGLIFYAVARMANRFIQPRFASGIRLYPQGFVIQRGPFGLRKRYCSYTGFLRILATPANGRLMFAFQANLFEAHPLSSFQRLFPTPQPLDEIIWLPTPPIHHPQQMIESFLEKAQAADIEAPHDIDLMPLLKNHLQYITWKQLREGLQVLLALPIWLIGYNPGDMASKENKIYRYPVPSTSSATWLTLGGLLVAGLGSIILDMLGASRGLVISMRILPLVVISGPAIWLLIQIFFKQAAVILQEQQLELRQPIRYFDRVMPYDQIGTHAIVDGDTLALIWLKPRRTPPGEEPRPPKPRLLTSVIIKNAQDCGQLLAERVQDIDDWTPEVVFKRKRRRAVRRRLLLFLVSPLISFILILLTIRLIFSFLNLSG